MNWLNKDCYTNIITHEIQKPSFLKLSGMNTISKLATLRQRVTLEEEQAIKELVSKYL
jgi:hypothetical protein